MENKVSQGSAHDLERLAEYIVDLHGISIEQACKMIRVSEIELSLKIGERDAAVAYAHSLGFDV